MYLKHLSLCNFKNYAEQEFEFNPKFNCIVGNNGSGKTNLLDAIHYLSFAKSFINYTDTQNIKKEESFFALHGNYQMEDETATISCIVKKGQKKEMRYNRKNYDKISDHVGKIPLISISPQDQDLIYDGSETRRKFLNNAISQFDADYLRNVIKYNHILEQRNNLLKSDSVDLNLFDVLDFQLDALGTEIFKARKLFLENFSPIFQKYFQKLSGEREEVSLQYESLLENNESLYQCLRNNFERDRYLEYTSAGIHKDDLNFHLDHFPLKKFGSQGQQKSFIIALKLAQLEYIALQKQFFPILLMDDIFDKLDKDRVYRLVDMVGEHCLGQIFLSDTDPIRTAKIFEQIPCDHKIIEIIP